VQVESDVCETFISLPTGHELRDPTVCVFLSQDKALQRSGLWTAVWWQTTVCMCVYILYTCIILVCPSVILPTGGSLPEHRW